MSIVARAAKRDRCPFARRAPAAKATIGRMAAEVRRLELELAEASQRLDRLEGAPASPREGRIPLEELLPGADLAGRWLQHRHLAGCELAGANLRQANLSQCDLRGADLENADLTNAILFSTDLRATNLRGAQLHGAKLDGALFDDDTVWPDFFRPVGACYLDPVVDGEVPA